MSDKKLTLVQRKNIKDNEPKVSTHLQKINAATGLEFTLEVDYLKVAEIDLSHYGSTGIGDVVVSYLEGLAINIPKLCQDSMAKEAFAEATQGKNKIEFLVLPRAEREAAFPGRMRFDPVCRFVEGTLQVVVGLEDAPSNMKKAGEDIEKLL